MKKSIILFLALLAAISLQGQSPALNTAVTRSDLTTLQPVSQKGQANGYAPLGSGTTVAPAYLFPGFATSPDNSIWTKSGSSLVPVSSLAISASGISSNNILVGQITSGIYGVGVNSGSYPLFLRGGGSRVVVDYGESIGSVGSDRGAYLWSIGPQGQFQLLSGTFSGDVSLSQNNLNNVLTISGLHASLNLSTATLSAPSGDLTLLAQTGGGVVVPSSASGSHPSYALNFTSANTLYGQLSAANVWSSTQTFSSAPVVPDASFAISKTSGLQSALNGLLQINGGNAATANLNMGGYRLTNLANPSSAQDAVTLSWLQGNYASNPVSSLAIQGGTPMGLTGATGSIILSMPPATSSTNGFLTASDWVTFNNKVSAAVPIFTGTLTSAIPVPVAAGGIGVATLTGIPKASGTNAFVAASPGTDYAIQVPTPPASSSDAGVPGTYAVSGSYVYFCVGSNARVRVTGTTTF